MIPLRSIPWLFVNLFLTCFLLAALQQEPQKQPSPAPTEDAPASIGLLLDNSHSMKGKLDSAVAALCELVKASNPQDEFFVINFNDDPYMDVDFTSNLKSVFAALRGADARGGTALNDAVVASADHFRKGPRYKKRALVVVTDGFDNESRLSAQAMLKKLQEPGMPIVYSIGLLEQGKASRAGKVSSARKALDLLAKETGGMAIYPENEKQLNDMALQIAQEIRKR